MTSEEFEKLRHNQHLIIEKQTALERKVNRVLEQLETVINNQLSDGDDFTRVKNTLKDIQRQLDRR